MNYVVVTRLGGIGDLLMLEPTIEALYYKHAPCRIILRTYIDYKDVFKDHPLVWKTVLDTNLYEQGLSFGFEVNTEDTLEFLSRAAIKSNLKLDIPPTALFHYDFQRVIEASKIHGVDAFAAHAEVTLLRRTPSLGYYKVASGNPRVVIQLRNEASDPTRNLKREELPLDLIKSLAPKAHFIDYKTSYEEYLNLISNADVFIGPDSSGLHLAHAAGVRSIVGIYSKLYPAQTRAYPGISWVHKGESQTLARYIELAIKEPKYPAYLNEGNAASFVKNDALLYCRGYGLDVGSSAWPLSGALACTEVDRVEKFAQGPFDFIHSSHCLEHISNWQEELKIWEQHLKPGGTLFVYLPHPSMEHWLPGGAWVGDLHVWSPSPVTLVKWMMENTSLRVQTYNCYPDSCWAFKIVARKDGNDQN